MSPTETPKATDGAEARVLLRRGTGIAAVSHETGFHDQPHLTRVFAKAYGVTPAVYRSTYRGTAWTDLAPLIRMATRTCNTPGSRRA
ncbi:helix-turn-helix domain-containing protein [Streptomyces sp. NPDC059460]|uniref:helix-turn-helix domain-containing protein n=1 Tax=Streptomyces sp. NPDC059460 TaxID=3346840 RepID=UPI0036758B56